MKKALPIPAVVAIIVLVVVVLGVYFAKANPSDNVPTGTKQGYDEKSLPPAATYKIPPPPEGVQVPGGSLPPSGPTPGH